MKLNENQELYMKTLSPIDQAIYTFSLISLKTHDTEERDCLIKIAGVCEACSDLSDPLVEAGRLLALMLVSEVELSTMNYRNSVIAAIELLEQIKENERIASN